MKTTSFHITLVAACKLTGRAGGFKINVWRDGTQKRYEFDAENGKQAGELGWAHKGWADIVPSGGCVVDQTIVSDRAILIRTTLTRARMKNYQADRNSMLPPPRPALASKR
jgi:hypothetical protein